MTTAVTISPTPVLAFLDNNGRPCVGGSVHTQVGGVDAATYQDSAGNIPLPNPIPLNNRGEISNASGVSCQLFLATGSVYTFTLFDANGNQLNQATYVATSNALAVFIAQLLSSIGSSLVGFTATGSAILRTVQDKLREWTSGTDFGADPTGVAPSGALINSALGAASYVDLGNGTYNIETPILIPAGKTLKLRGATLKPSANIVTVRLLGQSSRLSGTGSILVTGTNTSNAVEIGDVANNARQAIVERITVTGAGLNSFCGRHGNLVTLYKCSSVSALQDDYNWTQETVDCNAWNVISCDGNAPARDGHHLPGTVSISNPNNPRSHTFIGGSIQSAGRYGVYSGTPKNIWKGVYIETSATTDVFFDTFAFANSIDLSEGATYVNTPGVAGGNRIEHSNPDASGRRIDVLKFYGGGGTGNGFGIANNDGTAGECYWEKRSARNFVFAVATSGATQSTSFLNDAGGANQHVVIFGGNIHPSVANSFTCGESGTAWSGGFTQVAFTITSDENTKTDIRSLDDQELAVAKALLKLSKVYRLKSSVAEKGTAARLHTGMIAQAVAQAFVDQGLDPYLYAMNCRDAVMEGIGEPILDADGKPVMEDDESGKTFPMVDQVGRQKVGSDGQPEWLLSLRYEELFAFVLSALA